MANFDDKEFQAKDDMRILIESKNIMKDSKRKKAAMAQVRKEQAALKSITKSNSGNGRNSKKKK